MRTTKKRFAKLILLITLLTCTATLYLGNTVHAYGGTANVPNYNLAYRQMWAPNASVSYTDNVFTLASTAAQNTVYGNFNNNHSYTAQFDMQIDANANAAHAFKIFVRNYQSNLQNQNNGYGLVFSPTSLALYGNSGSTAILKVASGNLRDNVYRNYKIVVNDLEPVVPDGLTGIEIKVYIDNVLKIDYTFDGVLANYIDRTGTLITATPPPNGNNSAFHIYSLNVGARIKTPAVHDAFYEFDKKNDFDYALFEDSDKPELETINLSDKQVMDTEGVPATAILTMHGNTFEYSNSSGWGMYSTKTNLHTNFQTSFGIKFPVGTGLDAGRFRMVLRASENIYGTYGVGYGLLVNPTSIQILKRNRPYGQAANPETPVVKTFDMRSLNATSQYFEIQVYNRPNGSVVINLAVNGMAFQYVDDGSDLSLLEHLRYPLTDNGVHGIVMASGGTVVVTTAANNTNNDENYFAGKADNWQFQTDSQTIINGRGLYFPKNEINGIYSAQRLTNVRTKFNLSLSDIEQNGYYAVALKYNTATPASDFSNPANGYFAKFHQTGFAIEAYGQTMAAKYPQGMNLADGQKHLVNISIVTAINSVNISVSVDGENIYYSGVSSAWTDGYLQMSTVGTTATITAAEQKLSLNVAYVGNDLVMNVEQGLARYEYQYWISTKVTTDIGNLNDSQYIWKLAREFNNSASAIILNIGQDAVDESGKYNVIVRVKDGGNIIEEIYGAYAPSDIGKPVISSISVNDFVVNDKLTVIGKGTDCVVKVNANIEGLEYSVYYGEQLIETNTTGIFDNIDLSIYSTGLHTFTVKISSGTNIDEKNVKVYLHDEYIAEQIPVITSLEGETLVNGNTNFVMKVKYANGSAIAELNKDKFEYKLLSGNINANLISKTVNQTEGTLDVLFNVTYGTNGVYLTTGTVSREGKNTADDKILRYYRGYVRAAELTQTADATITDGNYTSLAGATVTITATGFITGVQSENLQYSFYREDASGWVLIRNYSSLKTLVWTPQRGGIYNIQARIKDINADSWEKESNIIYKIESENELGGILENVNIFDYFTNQKIDGNMSAGKPYLIQAQYSGTDKVLYMFTLSSANLGLIYINHFTTSPEVLFIPGKSDSYIITARVISVENFGYKDISKAITIISQTGN